MIENAKKDKTGDQKNLFINFIFLKIVVNNCYVQTPGFNPLYFKKKEFGIGRV